MTSAEFTRWRVFFSIQGWPDEREDFRAGQIVAAIYNVNRDTKKKPRPFQWTDFVPPLWKMPAKRESTEVLKEKALLITQAMKGKP